MYNNTEMKSVRIFTAATQHLTPDVVIIKNSGKIRFLESNQTKINMWRLQTLFYWVCSRNKFAI